MKSISGGTGVFMTRCVSNDDAQTTLKDEKLGALAHHYIIDRRDLVLRMFPDKIGSKLWSRLQIHVARGSGDDIQPGSIAYIWKADDDDYFWERTVTSPSHMATENTLLCLYLCTS